MLLDATGINVRYGRNHAVRNVDIALEEGEVITVLGANGAGKSSLLKAISGTENVRRQNPVRRRAIFQAGQPHAASGRDWCWSPKDARYSSA